MRLWLPELDAAETSREPHDLMGASEPARVVPSGNVTVVEVQVPAGTYFQAPLSKSTFEVPAHELLPVAAQSFLPAALMPKHFSLLASSASATCESAVTPASAATAATGAQFGYSPLVDLRIGSREHGAMMRRHGEGAATVDRGEMPAGYGFDASQTDSDGLSN